MNWPPTTMATQHPDNASVPWWKKDAFIATQDEIGELMIVFKDLGLDEYMWDWEGKYVDESVGEKLFSKEADFFREHPLGRDFHLTYRIPAFGQEGKMHRLARAFMNILSLADFASDIGLKRAPVTEMFLPLVANASQPLTVRRAFKEIASYHKSVFRTEEARHRELLNTFEVTPLVEDVSSLFSIDAIIRPFWKELLQERPQVRERGQRIFLARSDPAMNSGLVPAVLAAKAALDLSYKVGAEFGMPVYPILGSGSLPFRGSVNPTYTDTFLEQYAGTRTYCIQSGFRYDYPLADVKAAIAKIKSEAPKRQVRSISDQERTRLLAIAKLFEGFWKPTIEAIAPGINALADFVPPRRERLQHIGLFGYSRGIGAVKLPRAIVFTAALYSIGIPPELIATGRGLRGVQFREELPLLEQNYPALRDDLKHAGKYFNRENLEILAREGWKFNGTTLLPSLFGEILEDVRSIEEILGIALSPIKPHHMIHRNLTSTMFHRLRGERMDAEALKREVVEAGIIRRSLG